MTELEKLYYDIKNPIEDKGIIKILVSCHLDHIPMYLTHYNHNEKRKIKKNEDEEKKFDSLIFNTWKNSIINANVDNLSIIKNNSEKEEFLLFRSFLINSSSKNENELYDEVKEYKHLCKLFYRYSYQVWDDWHHIFASKIFLNKNFNFDVEHRLYLNATADNKYTLMIYYVNKCIDKGIPFYFKYMDYSNSDDALVIYCNTDYLCNNVKILREIASEHPELIEGLYYPPLVTGNIDGWIGYGSQPIDISTSYNRVRETIVSDTIESAINKWINKNNIYINSRMGYYEKKEYIKNYILNDCIENPEFIKFIQDEFKSVSVNYDIDENNFSIDNYVKRKMLSSKRQK